jgi:Na+/proline symporter
LQIKNLIIFCLPTQGGLKAVVWTDAVQCVFMLFSMFTVVILGIIRAGGFGAIFQAAEEGGRLEFFKYKI